MRIPHAHKRKEGLRHFRLDYAKYRLGKGKFVHGLGAELDELWVAGVGVPLMNKGVALCTLRLS